jgi:hypothetical protein
MARLRKPRHTATECARAKRAVLVLGRLGYLSVGETRRLLVRLRLVTA